MELKETRGERREGGHWSTRYTCFGTGRCSVRMHVHNGRAYIYCACISLLLEYCGHCITV